MQTPDSSVIGTDGARTPGCRPEDLQHLLDRLDPDPSKAAESYLSLRRRAAKIFTWNGCYPADDLAAEALDRVARKIKSEDIQDVVAYTIGVVQLMRKEAQRRAHREKSTEEIENFERVFTTSGHPESTIIETLDHRMWLEYLKKCLAALPKDDSHLILSFYSAEGERNMDHRHRLAKDLGLQPGTLRVRASRIRERLEHCINDRRKRDNPQAIGGSYS